ncbi:MAG: type IV toxin-antitoxin system AbiEi family antitoxin [Candidatus Thermoplasmatota archaeon]|jgi:predicted transcriptional regulator|nr:type IV toxin-antitoxin system AbiEi family antitoxin [Candidatus Thermoplasmatota archaeon]
MKESELIKEFSSRIELIIPHLKVMEIQKEVPTERTVRVDLIIKVAFGKSERTLVVEVKNIGEPKIAESAIAELKTIVNSFPNAYPVFAAPYLSERTRQICILEGVGYIDLTGNVYLNFGSILIDKTSKNITKIERENNRSILSNKATRVIRALLENQNQEKRIVDLARECNMSSAGVYYVLNGLELKGYVLKDERKKVKVIQPRRLLTDWGRNWTVEKSSSERYFSFARDTDSIMEEISISSKKVGYKYYLTGMAGASLVSPFVRYNDVWLYGIGDKDALIADLDLRPVPSGGNVVILNAYDEGVYMGSRTIRGLSVVSNVQLFVDLYSYPARGQEQAEKILEVDGRFRGD